MGLIRYKKLLGIYARTQNTNNARMKSLGQKGRGVIGKKYSYGLELENGL